jgi:hypothetical protein
VPAFTHPDVLDRADELDVEVPRGEARTRVAAVANALALRKPERELAELLTKAAELLVGADEAGSELGHAVAYRAALPVLARSPAVQGPLAEAEPVLAQMDDEDRAQFAPGLARAAVPALAIDVELMKADGYEFVAIYPPAGSEGVDVVGRAANWLTRRMTMEDDGPRVSMRRFLAVLAEEVEVELPVASALLDELAAAPMPDHPPDDAPFLSLARGLVEEAIAERGFPW